MQTMKQYGYEFNRAMNKGSQTIQDNKGVISPGNVLNIHKPTMNMMGPRMGPDEMIN